MNRHWFALAVWVRRRRALVERTALIKSPTPLLAGTADIFFILKRSKTNPGQWEHPMVNGSSALIGEPAAIATLLNPLGQEGWDIAGVTGPVLIMKRGVYK